MIYATAFPKGGVGKTTLAVHLASFLGKESKTLLIDGDPQRKASTWVEWRREGDAPIQFTTVQLIGKAIFDEGRSLSESYDHVVIDVPGENGLGIRNALLLADKVICPMANAAFDVSEISAFEEIFEQASTFNRGLQRRALLNKVQGSSRKAREFIQECGLPLFETEMLYRRSHVNASEAGNTIEEYRPMDKLAIRQYHEVMEEIGAWQ